MNKALLEGRQYLNNEKIRQDKQQNQQQVLITTKTLIFFKRNYKNKAKIALYKTNNKHINLHFNRKNIKLVFSEKITLTKKQRYVSTIWKQLVSKSWKPIVINLNC